LSRKIFQKNFPKIFEKGLDKFLKNFQPVDSERFTEKS